MNPYNINYYVEICRNFLCWEDFYKAVLILQNGIEIRLNHFFSDILEFINDELFLKMNHPYYLNRNFVEIGKNEKVRK